MKYAFEGVFPFGTHLIDQQHVRTFGPVFEMPRRITGEHGRGKGTEVFATFDLAVDEIPNAFDPRVGEDAPPAQCTGAKFRLLLKPADHAHLSFGQQRGGVAGDRVAVVGPQPKDEYLELHHKINLLLDPVPSGGQTTLCDGLGMGLPAVTLAGRTPMARGGVSLLANAGLPEFIAATEEDYVRIAVAAARDFDRLAALRGNLRSRLEASL